MALGDRIRELREEQGLSVSELARISGVAKGWLWELEQHRETAKRPSGATLLKVADALGTTIARLLENDASGASEQAPADELPQGLLQFAKTAKLPAADIKMLASIRYRGQAPQGADDWRFIYESIRRTVEKR